MSYPVTELRRDSDRLVTPVVVCTALVIGGVVVLSVVAGMVVLTLRGLDPDPMLRLVAQVGGLVGGLGTLALQLADRATKAKTERNIGRLATEVAGYRDEIRGRHAAPDDETTPTGGAE